MALKRFEGKRKKPFNFFFLPFTSISAAFDIKQQQQQQQQQQQKPKVTYMKAETSWQRRRENVSRKNFVS